MWAEVNHVQTGVCSASESRVPCRRTVPTTTRTSPTPPQATGMVTDLRLRVMGWVLRNVSVSGCRSICA